MIDDATLDHNRHTFAVDASCECGITLSELISSQDAEIRRLRQDHEGATNNINPALDKIDTLKADLAAHRAVVREASTLIDLLGCYVEAARTIKPTELVHQKVEAEWKEFQDHPLVQRAREEK